MLGSTSKNGDSSKAGNPENFFPQFIFTPGLAPGQVNAQLVPMSGIPMRDYFAGKVLATCCDSFYNGMPDSPRGVAEWCYRVADAMMEARKETPEAKGFPYTDGAL